MQHLLRQYGQLHSTDLEHVQQHIGQVLCPHHLRLTQPHQLLNTELYYRASEQLGFGRLRYGANVSIHPEPLLDFYLLQIPINGHERITLLHDQFDSDSQSASMINPADEFNMEHSSQADKLFIRICKSSLELFFEQYYQRPLQSPLRFTVLQPLHGQTGASLWNVMQWLFTEISQGMLFDHLNSTKRLEETFFATLLDLWQHNQRLMPSHYTAVTPHSIRKAKAFIEEHYSQALTVERIAATVGISSRSLYAGFKDYVGQSPMQFVKQIRLERARTLLLTADPAKNTVTQIALSCGFSHLGQFAIDYQQRYAERPSATLLQ